MKAHYSNPFKRDGLFRELFPLLLLIFSSGVSIANVIIPLNDPKVYYDGVFYPVITSSSVVFNRHTSAAYSDPSSGIVYAPCNTTRNTQTGIRIRFKTSSPHIYMTFSQRSADGYFAIGTPTNGFTVFADGVEISSYSALSFTITSPSSGATVLYEVTLPNLWSVDFTGLQLDNGYSLVDAGVNIAKKYAAFGTSITHGTGQYVNTAKTYAFKLAKNKGWNLHNCAVAGSIVGWQLAYDVKNQPAIDYITVEQGFNDWATSYPQSLATVTSIYARFIDSLRRFQPGAKIYCIAPITTTYVPSAPPYTLDAFRSEVKNIVDTRTAAGDNKIFFINGASFTDGSMLDDGIHLNESGAAQVAAALIDLIEPATVLAVAGFIPASDPNFLYTGRIDFTNPKRPQFSFPGVSIKGNFQGTSLSVVIKDYAAGGDQTTNYFYVFIDGAPTVLKVNNTDTLYPITTSLANVNHSLEIFKRTESSVGKSEFRGVVLVAGKVLNAPPIRPSRRFEFIGDSYTCGYGDEVSISQSGNPNTGFHSVYENNYIAWGALASRAMNAEYVCTSYSGRGMYRNNSGQTTYTIPSIYDEIIPDQVTPIWNKNNYIPNVVVIHLGTNDFYPISLGNPLDSASFVNTYKTFVAKLRGYYTSACIVLAVPNGLSDWYPVGANNLTHAKNYIKAIVNHFNGLGDSKVYNFVMTPQGSQGEPYGEDWHPSAQTQQIMANDLLAFLNGIVACVTPLPVTLTEFDARTNQNTVVLHWSTSSEENNDHFVIERSKDGENFEAIGKVKGNGNSNQLLQYTYTDKNPLPGKNYYRLNQVDIDGRFGLSDIKYANINNNFAAKAFPNPNSGKFSISIDGDITEEYHYEVLNVTGQVVDRGVITESTADVNLSQQLGGLFFVKVYSNNNSTALRVIVE